MSLTPGATGVKTYFPQQDKVVHFIFYFVMVLLILKNFETIKTKEILIAIISTALYGVMMEVLQATMGMGRHFDNLDILANISGSLIGAAIFILNANRGRVDSSS